MSQRHIALLAIPLIGACVLMATWYAWRGGNDAALDAARHEQGERATLTAAHCRELGAAGVEPFASVLNGAMAPTLGQARFHTGGIVRDADGRITHGVALVAPGHELGGPVRVVWDGSATRVMMADRFLLSAPSASAAQNLHDRIKDLDCRVGRQHTHIPVFTVEIAAADVWHHEAMRGELTARLPGWTVESDPIASLNSLPDDARMAQQWYLHNDGSHAARAVIDLPSGSIDGRPIVFASLAEALSAQVIDIGDADTVADMPPAVAGQFALTSSGSLLNKIDAAEQAGAIAMIVHVQAGDEKDIDAGFPSAQPALPTVVITHEQAQPLLTAASPLVASLSITGAADVDIDAPEAWAQVQEDHDVLVAVLDTGVDYQNQELAAAMWQNPGETPGNGIDDDGNGVIDDVFGYDAIAADGDPLDAHGHGTLCASIIAAGRNDGMGIAGIAARARILALRSFNSSGSGTQSDQVACIDYLLDLRSRGHDVRLVNASFGFDTETAALATAIDTLTAQGVVVVAACGNSAQDNDVQSVYPASASSSRVLSIGATNTRDTLASMSNFGRTSVDLMAPGVGILGYVLDDELQAATGTSFAAPQVVGACALLWSVEPSLDADALIDRVLAGVDVLPALTSACATGGRLNLRRLFGDAALRRIRLDNGGDVSHWEEVDATVPGVSVSGQTVFENLSPGQDHAFRPVLSSVEALTMNN